MVDGSAPVSWRLPRPRKPIPAGAAGNTTSSVRPLTNSGASASCTKTYLREQAWDKWSKDERDKTPDYCLMPAINRYTNFENKGELWVQRTKYILDAKRELAEEAKNTGIKKAP